MLLRNPFCLLLIFTFLRLGSARSSSSSWSAASLAWAEGPTALSYKTCSPWLLGCPLCLGETLPPWNSQDKKCCLCKMPYVAAPIRVLGNIITRTAPYVQLPLDAPTRTRNISLFKSDVFLRRPILSYQDSYVHFLQGGPQAKVVPERTTYLAWGVPQRVPSSVSSRVLCSDMASWAQTSGTLKIKMQEKYAERSALTHARHSHCTSRQLGMRANWRYDVPEDWLWDACLLARVCWGTSCEEFCSKKGLHYPIKQSSKNPLKCDQVQRVLGKLSRSCHRTSNNKPWFTSLEIPWEFPTQAVLPWLSRG